MKINYVATVKAIIVFDGVFNYDGMKDAWHSLEECVNKAVFYMSEYCFDKATIVDYDTGEILVELESEECNLFTS